MKFFGTRPTYQMFAGATFITGCIYYLFNKFYLRKRQQTVEEQKDMHRKKISFLDVENCDKKETDKNNVSLDVTSKVVDKQECLTNEKVNIKNTNLQKKLIPDNIDGSSDSGVDNPGFIETDSSNVTK